MLTFSYPTTHSDEGFSLENLKRYLSDLPARQQSLIACEQGFVSLHHQDTQPIKDIANHFINHIDQVCILGIGGSMLGPQFLYNALGSKSKGKQLDFIFLDNIDPDFMVRTRRKLQLQRTLFLVQSKSGQTPETVAQYAYFLNEILNQGLYPGEHFVFVTDPIHGFLRKEGNNKAFKMLDIPPSVGGRFSVLTPVGLLTAALAGIDIDQLLAGSRDIIENQLNTIQDASSYTYASLLDHYYKKNKSINVIFPYAHDLRLFSTWAVQLISESTGKKTNRDNEIVNWGITPLPALGVTDQHSQLQLFIEGPANKVITLIEISKHIDTTIDSNKLVAQHEELGFLSDKTFSNLFDAEFLGTKQSLVECDIPTPTITLDIINEYSIGQLIQFFQLTIGYLGEITNIDMFNQPGVERSKILAKQNLK